MGFQVSMFHAVEKQFAVLFKFAWRRVLLGGIFLAEIVDSARKLEFGAT